MFYCLAPLGIIDALAFISLGCQLYLLSADNTADPSTLKFARYLEQNNELWVTQVNPKKGAGTANNNSQANTIYEWSSAQRLVSGAEVAIQAPVSKEGADLASKDVLVIAAPGLNFKIIEQILVELPIKSGTVSISANAYHHRFDKTVINLACSVSNVEACKEQLNVLCEKFFIDMFLRPKLILQQAGLAVFDMDSTVIEMECIDEIAKLAGVGEEVSAVTERAMQGEIAFGESLYHRVACLQGVELTALLSIRERLPFVPGFASLLIELKSKGWIVLIASGGFTYFADHIKQLFDLDYAFSNTLEVIDGRLSGKILGDVVDAQAKADILSKLAQQHNIPLSNTIAVGDGANDLVMMATAGAGIAFKAKPKVQAKADLSVRFSGLEAVLYALG